MEATRIVEGRPVPDQGAEEAVVVRPEIPLSAEAMTAQDVEKFFDDVCEGDDKKRATLEAILRQRSATTSASPTFLKTTMAGAKDVLNFLSKHCPRALRWLVKTSIWTIFGIPTSWRRLFLDLVKQAQVVTGDSFLEGVFASLIQGILSSGYFIATWHLLESFAGIRMGLVVIVLLANMTSLFYEIGRRHLTAQEFSERDKQRKGGRGGSVVCC